MFSCILTLINVHSLPRPHLFSPPLSHRAQEVMGEEVMMTAFMPSIPNLVYQYNLYTNYASEVFANKNPEIPE